MNNTNRALNRTVLAIAGLVSLAIGASIVWMLVDPNARTIWRSTGGTVTSWADDVFGRPLWAGTTLSLAAVIALVVALVLVVLLIAFASRQGGGSTGTVLRARSDDGEISIDTAIPSALLAERLADVPGVATLTVSAYRVRRQSTLKLTVNCRRGAAPRTVVDAIDDAVVRLEGALGARPIVYAQLTGGFRSRIHSPIRVDTSTTTARSS
ncbi:hypothetical protein ASE16_18840 [Leifsonia sp. Root227]|uniref:hypothetical protein n=1 Tax=Leifsonia sp. Root227 TaxID=1736496 RepID=UPI0006FEC904|nr:hypothetical protein [Leifsonia sp. Root227]KRC47355.1 hypothetical protein ASE16_18840 [Leifsonia sp. Root227]